LGVVLKRLHWSAGFAVRCRRTFHSARAKGLR